MKYDEQLAYWRRYFATSWPGQEICTALTEKFLDRIEIVDPDAFAALERKPVLYLANHQTYLESVLFTVALPPITGHPTVALAKTAHREGWLGRFIDLVFSHPAAPPHIAVEYFDREQPGDIGEVIARLTGLVESGYSLLVHVEGTRRRSARRGRVLSLSPLWIGLAMTNEWPIVPVRFVGGLPVEDQGKKFDAPVGYGEQIIRIGRPISTAELLERPVDQRVPYVRSAINALQDPHTEEAAAPDPAFAAAVAEWVERTGADPMAATILEALRRYCYVRDPELAAGLAAGERVFTDVCDALVTAADLWRRGPTALRLSDDAEGDWLGRVARFLFGPRGPMSMRAASAPDAQVVRVEKRAEDQRQAG